MRAAQLPRRLRHEQALGAWTPSITGKFSIWDLEAEAPLCTSGRVHEVNSVSATFYGKLA
jgi:hypothetical protein